MDSHERLPAWQRVQDCGGAEEWAYRDTGEDEDDGESAFSYDTKTYDTHSVLAVRGRSGESIQSSNDAEHPDIQQLSMMRSQ